MSISTIVLEVAIASACMVVCDVISVIMVQAEATYRRRLAALMDTVGWLVGITTTLYSLKLLDSHSVSAKIVAYVCVGAANFYGTWLGVGIGAKLTSRHPTNLGPITSAIRRRLSSDNGMGSSR